MNRASLSLVLLILVVLCSPFDLSSQSPANNIPFSVIKDGQGIYAGQYNFRINTLKAKKLWKAKWIWLNKSMYPSFQYAHSVWIKPAEGPEKNYRALFRKSFNVADNTKSTLLYITADVRYRLFINGKLAEEGPVNKGSDYDDTKPANYHYYSIIDISKLVKNGTNEVAIEVFSWALEISEHSSGYGLLRCEIDHNGKTIDWTNENWKSTIDTSYATEKGVLQFNANKEPSSWTTANYSSWTNSSEQILPATASLYHSQIPGLLKTIVSPVNIYKSVKEFNFDAPISPKQSMSNGQYVFDFGKNMSARWACTVYANQGDTLEFVHFEKKGQRPVLERRFRLITKKGLNNFQSPNLCSYRYLQVTIKASQPVSQLKPEAIFTTYPVNFKGSFECSDQFYNQLWKTARYSTQLCMHDMFFDSPMHQEPIACTGDYLIESINNYNAFGDPFLTRQNLVQTAQMMEKNDYKMFHTSYSLLWVQMLRQYVLHTRDTAVLRTLVPHAHLLMKRFISYLNKDFLVTEAPNYMFMDWIGIHKYNAHHPPAMIGSGYMTAFLYKAMIDLDDLCAWMGEPAQYKDISSNIKKGMNEILWDKDKELYRDGIPFSTSVKPSFWLPADSNLITYSAHVNTLAVAYDMAPASMKDKLMQYVVTQTDYELQPYFMFYVLQATKSAQNIPLGLGLLERWRAAIDTSTGTLKENWQDVTSTGYGGDYSHAWAGAPLAYLSQNVLGIEPGVKPFTYSASLAIHPTLKWAKGKIPTYTNQTIDIEWKEQAGSYVFNYIVPQKLTLTVKPAENLGGYELWLNQQKINVSEPFTLKPGKHSLQLKPVH